MFACLWKFQVTNRWKKWNKFWLFILLYNIHFQLKLLICKLLRTLDNKFVAKQKMSTTSQSFIFTKQLSTIQAFPTISWANCTSGYRVAGGAPLTITHQCCTVSIWNYMWAINGLSPNIWVNNSSMVTAHYSYTLGCLIPAFTWCGWDSSSHRHTTFQNDTIKAVVK